MEQINNILLGTDARDKIVSGINKLAETVKVTFGPFGRTVIIADPHGKPYLTKDGVSVSNFVKLDDLVENTGASLVKEVAQTTAREAGDGTTTSIILVQALINAGITYLNDGGNYNDIKKSFTKIIPKIIKELKTNSKKLNKNNTKNVAKVAANNDEIIADLLNDAFKLSDNIELQDANDITDELIYSDGLKYESTYFSKLFITDKSKLTATLHNPLLLIIDGKVENLDKLEVVLTSCNKEERPLVIITDAISDNALKLLETNQINKALKLLVIKSPGFGPYRRSLLLDLAIATGTTLIRIGSKHIATEELGEIKRITTDFNNTLIIVKDKELLQDHKKLLISQLKNKELNPLQILSLTKRLSCLSTNSVLLKIGGTSEVDMKERKDRVEDAVKAVQSALSEGILLGGGAALNNICTILMKEKNITNIDKIILKALTTPYNLIKDSCGDAYSIDNVYDPVKVVRCAVENAASVASVILGTGAIISKPTQWN